MLAFVTGATGLVGANLVAALNERGHAVRILRRATSRLDALEGLTYEEVIGDVLDEASLIQGMEGCDWVFHAAGVADYWRSGVEWLYRVNVIGTRRVMTAALKCGVRRVVHTSSVAALGVPEPGQLLDESHSFNLRPEQFRYGHSKALAEREVLRFVEQGLPAVIVNPGAILGPRDVHFISGSLIREVARHWIPISLPGGMSLIDVRAVAEAQIAAAERGRVGHRYILGGINIYHHDLLTAVARVVGQRPPIMVVPRPLCVPLAWGLAALQLVWPRPLPMSAEQLRLSVETFFVNSEKAERELGLRPTVLEQVIYDTYAWYRDHGML